MEARYREIGRNPTGSSVLRILFLVAAQLSSSSILLLCRGRPAHEPKPPSGTREVAARSKTASLAGGDWGSMSLLLSHAIAPGPGTDWIAGERAILVTC